MRVDTLKNLEQSLIIITSWVLLHSLWKKIHKNE